MSLETSYNRVKINSPSLRPNLCHRRFTGAKKFWGFQTSKSRRQSRLSRRIKNPRNTTGKKNSSVLKVQLHVPKGRGQHTRFHCYDNRYHPPPSDRISIISGWDCVRAGIIERTHRRSQSYLIFHRIHRTRPREKCFSFPVLGLTPFCSASSGSHWDPRARENAWKVSLSLSVCLLRKKKKKGGENYTRQSSVNIEIVWWFCGDALWAFHRDVLSWRGDHRT